MYLQQYLNYNVTCKFLLDSITLKTILTNLFQSNQFFGTKTNLSGKIIDYGTQQPLPRHALLGSYLFAIQTKPYQLILIKAEQ